MLRWFQIPVVDFPDFLNLSGLFQKCFAVRFVAFRCLEEHFACFGQHLDAFIELCQVIFLGDGFVGKQTGKSVGFFDCSGNLLLKAFARIYRIKSRCFI